MKRFNSTYNKLMEMSNVASTAFGSPDVSHSVFSSDKIYAPGDARMPSFLGQKKKKGKKSKKVAILMQRCKLSAA